ncbi:putative integral membrane protein [Pseudoalteromonas luteoviolacea B = ATCC 29581]|nr:putative integral membrane protein [Pseudoalteromonas luteoviolacea B = ATCC 29581]
MSDISCLYFLIFFAVIFRCIFYFYYGGTSNVGFQLPLLLEFLFVLPTVFISLAGYFWDFYAALFLYLCCFALQIGLMPLARLKNMNLIASLNIRFALQGIYFLTFFYGFCFFLTFYEDLARVTDSASLFELANKNAVARYDGTQSLGLVYKFASLAGYLMSFLFGMIFATVFKSIDLKNKRKLVTCFVFFIFLLFFESLITASRAGFLLQLFSFLTSLYFWIAALNNGHSFSFSLKNIIVFFFFFTFIISFFVIVQALRGGNEDFDLIDIVSHVMVWFFGYIPAFAKWFSSEADVFKSINLGASSFAGLFDLLGVSYRKSGVYELVQIGNNRVTNVYTAFRGLVEDFGVVGSVLILIFIGVIISLSFVDNVYRSFIRYFGLMFIFIFSWSFVISPFIYNTILFSFVLYSVLSHKFLLIKLERGF